MASVVIQCRNCRADLEITGDNTEHVALCGKCNTANHVYTYPALWTGGAAGSAGEQVLVDDESACFYHPEKRAAVVCDGCGRFLCSLCDVEYKGKHVCSACIEQGTLDKEDTFQSEYVRYDSIALLVVGLPIVTFLFASLAVVTAPIALFMCIRYWRAPLGPVPVTRWRYLVAGILSLLVLLFAIMTVVISIGPFVSYE